MTRAAGADLVVQITTDPAEADQRVSVVADQVLTATAADAGKVVTVAADGTLELAAPSGGGTTIVSKTQGLTNETTSTTAAEQWGTEEVVFDEADFDGAVSIDARLQGYVVDLDGNEFCSIRLQGSIDGGATWLTGSDTVASKNGTFAATDDNREPVTAQLLLSGLTPTGSIQVRAQVTTPNGAGTVKFQGGRIYATVRDAHPSDAGTNA